MTLLKHFDYTPDQGDASVRFELRSQAPEDDGEARVVFTVVDLESDENLTVQLAPPDVEGLIEALDQALGELAPSEEAADEEVDEEEVDEEEATDEEVVDEEEVDEEEDEDEDEEEDEEPEPERPARRTRGSKRKRQDDSQ
jgi:hypothetical protein